MANKFETSPIEKKPGKEVREEEKERVQPQKEITRPWERMTREVEERMIERYISSGELSRENQRLIDDLLREGVERKIIEFGKKWFDEHREEFQAEGISLALSEEKKAGIALERGALEELKRKEEFREEYEQIENLNTLRLDLEKKHLPIESRFLLLNFLNKKAEEIKQEIEKKKKEGKPIAEIEIQQIELDRLFEAQKELAQKTSGRDLEREVKDELRSKLEPQPIYVETRLEKRKTEVIEEEKLGLFVKEWQRLSGEEKEKYKNNPLNFAESRIESICRQLKERKIEIDEEECLALLSAGYNPEEFRFRGILRRRIEVKRGELISKIGLFEFLEDQKERFGRKIERKARDDLENQWTKLENEWMRREMEAKIKELAESPERAIEGIEGVYRKVKERLLVEWVERDLKKEPKGKEKLEKIEKEFSKGGKNPREFMADIISRKGPLGELTGNLTEDEGKLLEFFRNYGFNLKEGDIKAKMDPEKYSEVVRRERGFLDFLLEFVFYIIAFLAAAMASKETKERGTSKETRREE